MKFLLIILHLTLLAFGRNQAKNVVNGSLDLSNYEFSSNKTVKLDGDWHFFWNRLVEPTDSQTQPDTLFNLPSYWSGYVLKGEKLPSCSYATLKMKLLLPEKREQLFITLPEQCSATKLWINDSLIVEIGNVSNFPELYNPGAGQINVALPNGNRQYLTLQVANYTSNRSGAVNSLILGTQPAIERYWAIRKGIDLILIGWLLLMGFYLCFIFFFRRHQFIYLIVVIICITWAIRFLALGMAGRFVLIIFPDIPYNLLVMMELVPLFSIAALLLNFAYLLFPGILSSKIVIAWWILSGTSILYAIFAPQPWLIDITMVNEITNIIAIIPFYYLMTKAIIKKMAGAITITIGFTLFVIFGINDILFDMRIIYTDHFINFGIMAICLSFVIHLLRRYVHSLHTMERLSAEQTARELKMGKSIPAIIGCELLNEVISYWESCNTGKTKIDLAKESGLWQVYMNPDGWERTQTLDKYLNADTFPQKPRWNRVISTVEYVLSHSTCTNPNRAAIEKKLETLREII